MKIQVVHTEIHIQKKNIKGSRAVIKSKPWKSVMAAFLEVFGRGKVEENSTAATTKEDHNRVL